MKQNTYWRGERAPGGSSRAGDEDGPAGKGCQGFKGGKEIPGLGPLGLWTT